MLPGKAKRFSSSGVAGGGGGGGLVHPSFAYATVAQPWHSPTQGTACSAGLPPGYGYPPAPQSRSVASERLERERADGWAAGQRGRLLAEAEKAAKAVAEMDVLIESHQLKAADGVYANGLGELRQSVACVHFQRK